MKVEIANPITDRRLQELYDALSTSGCRVRFFTDSRLKGTAFGSPTDCEVVFKTPGNVTQRNIAHELLHINCWRRRGYPIIRATDLAIENAIVTINDAFQHIMIAPELRALGFSIYEDESPMILDSIERIPAYRANAAVPANYKRIVLCLLYTKSVALPIGASDLARLKNAIEGEGMYDGDLIEFLLQNLPDEGTTVADFRSKLQACVEQLEMANAVEWLEPSTRTGSW